MKSDIENDADQKDAGALYPYTSLAPSLKIADAIKELGGARAPVPKSSLAAHLKESEKSASLLLRIASAKAFGMIVGKSDYSLSEAAKGYYFPTSENDKSNAILQFLAAPFSFSEIIKRYDGDKLPPREILGNVFGRDLKVPESWKERAASFFENSAQFAGVIDENRILRVKAAQYAAKSVAAPSVNTPPPSAGPKFYGGDIFNPPGFGSESPEEHSLYLDKERKRKVTLSCPLNITRPEYDRICKWIDATWIIEEEKKDEIA